MYQLKEWDNCISGFRPEIICFDNEFQYSADEVVMHLKLQ